MSEFRPEMPEDLFHAAHRGVEDKLPPIEVFPNVHQEMFLHEIVNPEYSSVCPKTGMPDYGTIHIRYVADQYCMELKSLKYYFYAYRGIGIFYENIVNKVMNDVIAACDPHAVEIRVEMTPRGGIKSNLVRRHVKTLVAEPMLDFIY